MTSSSPRRLVLLTQLQTLKSIRKPMPRPRVVIPSKRAKLVRRTEEIDMRTDHP